MSAAYAFSVATACWENGRGCKFLCPYVPTGAMAAGITLCRLLCAGAESGSDPLVCGHRRGRSHAMASIELLLDTALVRSCGKRSQVQCLYWSCMILALYLH